MSAADVTTARDAAELHPNLDAVFDPASVAIYGISERTSARIAENMTVPGIPFYGVNPTKQEACGVRCYPSMAACPTVPDMVVMGVGHGRIEAAVDDVLSVEGVRAVITPGLGNEAGVRLLAAMEQAERRGTAAVTYQGAMVDIAMVKTARQMLDLARAVGVEVP